jgi:hypothetical protein
MIDNVLSIFSSNFLPNNIRKLEDIQIGVPTENPLSSGIMANVGDVTFTTVVGGQEVTATETVQNAFRIENIHGVNTVIINPNFDFAFPALATSLLNSAFSKDASKSPEAITGFARGLRIALALAEFSPEELFSLNDQEFGQRTLLIRLCSLHMLKSLKERDNLNIAHQELLELAKDKDLNMWVKNKFNLEN